MLFYLEGTLARYPSVLAVIVSNMLCHVVGELVPFEGLINHLDQNGVLRDFYRLVVFVVDVKIPLSVVLELYKGLVDLLNPFLFVETFFKQEVFDRGLRYHIDLKVVKSY
jgi:hypothetical protein